jgi:hypothetical protein
MVHGWEAPAAQCLRFVLDFGYGTGLRASELVRPSVVPAEVDGSNGTLRAPRESCALRAGNDYEAVQAELLLLLAKEASAPKARLRVSAVPSSPVWSASNASRRWSVPQQPMGCWRSMAARTNATSVKVSPW